MKNRFPSMRWPLLLLLVAGLATSCVEEERVQQLNFTSTIEGMVDLDTASHSGPSSKVFLQKEKWLYWEDGDIISIGSNTSGGANNYMAQLANVNAGFVNDPDGDWQQFNGIFITNLPEESRYFVGLHPYSPNNVITPHGANSPLFDVVQIECPAEQPFTGSDLTFARNVVPMVAWYGGKWTPEQPSEPFNLDFHALASIVRIQFFYYGDAGGEKTAKINKITLTSEGRDGDEKPLAGIFDVKDYNTAYPYLGETGASTKSITIPCDGREVSEGEIISFYVVIPTTKRNVIETRKLKLLVENSTGTTDTAKLTVPIRRCGIVFPPALGIEKNGMDHAGYPDQIGLAGYGTEERPYKIYTRRDLEYVRFRFLKAARTNTTPLINGVEVTTNTVFHLMRNDIDLYSPVSSEREKGSLASKGTNEDDFDLEHWHGIRNFTGKFVWRAYGGAQNPGLHNYSYNPIFHSITAGSQVIDLPVAAAPKELPDPDLPRRMPYFSSFCTENYGEIINCRVYHPVDDDSDPNDTDPMIEQKRSSTKAGPLYSYHMAGFAVNNSGLITDCSCEAHFEFSEGGSASGITYENTANGIVRRCAAATPMRVSCTYSGWVAGISHFNRGLIEDSYFTMRHVSGNMLSWAGISYYNFGTVRHCYMSATAAIATLSSVAGIVMNNGDVEVSGSAVVDNCWFQGSITGNGVAGIVLNNSKTIISCYVNGGQIISESAGFAGGLVGKALKGSVLANSYYYAPRIYEQEPTVDRPVGALVAIADGEDTIDNCYAYETGFPIHDFIAALSGSSMPTVTNCYHVGHADYGHTGINCNVTSSTTRTMLTSLNANKDNYGTGVEWEDAEPPVLKTTQDRTSKSGARAASAKRWVRR